MTIDSYLPADRFDTTVLPNGIRVVSETMPHVQSVTLGVWVRSGSRYEIPAQAGISHLVEHMLFKGTRKRSASQINECLYPMGGQLNAFTDREFTCYSAVVLGEHLHTAIELISDMLVNSVFASSELDREKNVVLEEIRATEDAPEDLVHDNLFATIWANHPLGLPVIGRFETVESFTSDEVVDYVSAHYTADGVLIAAAGNVQHTDLVADVERYLADMGGSTALLEYQPPNVSPRINIAHRKTEQAHICLGMPAFAQMDDDNYSMVVLDTVIGGGPHSRLFDEIRENRGLAYNVGSCVTSYAEGGLFTVYASGNPKNTCDLLQIMREQLDRVVQDGLTDDEIELARQHIRSSWLLSHESTGSRMGRIANSQLYFDRIISFEEVIQKLNAITKEDVWRVAQSVLLPDRSALAVIGPIKPDGREAARLDKIMRSR